MYVFCSFKPVFMSNIGFSGSQCLITSFSLDYISQSASVSLFLDSYLRWMAELTPRFSSYSLCKCFFGHVCYSLFKTQSVELSIIPRLNARKVLRGKSQGSSDKGDHAMPVLFPENYSRYSRGPYSVSPKLVSILNLSIHEFTSSFDEMSIPFQPRWILAFLLPVSLISN